MDAVQYELLTSNRYLPSSMGRYDQEELDQEAYWTLHRFLP